MAALSRTNASAVMAPMEAGAVLITGCSDGVGIPSEARLKATLQYRNNSQSSFYDNRAEDCAGCVYHSETTRAFVLWFRDSYWMSFPFLMTC